MMRKHLTELRAKRAAGESGFTLIELLVVVVIIGILIAIAIPVYLNYQKGAKDKSAASDLRNAVSVFEQCNSDNNAYPTADFTIAASGAAGTCAQTLNVTSGTTIKYYIGTSGGSPAYSAVAVNSGGSPKTYCYASAAGGSVKAVTGTVPNAFVATCPA